MLTVRALNIKAANFQMLNNNNKKKGKYWLVMFTGEIYYYCPLNLSEKVEIVGKNRFSLNNLLRY